MKTKEEIDLIKQLIYDLCEELEDSDAEVEVTPNGEVNIKCDDMVEMNFDNVFCVEANSSNLQKKLLNLGWKHENDDPTSNTFELEDVPTLDFGGLFKWGTIEPINPDEENDCSLWIYEFGGKDLSGFPILKTTNGVVNLQYCSVETFHGLSEGIKSVTAKRCRNLNPGHDHSIDEIDFPSTLEEFRIFECEPSDGWLHEGKNKFCIYDKMRFEDWKERFPSIKDITTNSVSSNEKDPNDKDTNGEWVYKDFPTKVEEKPKEEVSSTFENISKSHEIAKTIIDESGIVSKVQEYMKKEFGERPRTNGFQIDINTWRRIREYDKKHEEFCMTFADALFHAIDEIL